MKVRMRVGITGTRDRESWPPAGGVIDVPDGEAEDLLRMGAAVGADPAAMRLQDRMDRLRRR